MSRPRSRSLLLIALAGAGGLLAGLAGLYVGGGFPGNPAVAAECRPSAERAAALVPHARGEVAAFTVERNPTPIPALAFKDGQGRDVRIADFRGRAVLLNLWATWCAPCRHEMPALDRLEAERGGTEFAVVAVSIDLRDDTKPREFYRETNITRLPFYQDATGRIFQELRVVGRAVGMPTTVLIDPAGCILGHLSGPAEWASADALALVDAALRR